MNTPTIAAALPNSLAPASTRTGAASNDNESGAASFSQILGRQHAAQGQQGQQTQSTASDAGHASPKADRGGDTEKKGKEAADDAETATPPGDQSLSLPQIALNLAAHAMPRTEKAAAADAPVTDRPTIQPAKGKAATIQASLETGPAIGNGNSVGSGNAADIPTAIASDAQDPMAAGAKGASPAAGNAVADAARSALSALNQVKPEAKLDDKPTDAGAPAPDDNDAPGANTPAARGPAQPARAQVSATAQTMAAAQAVAVSATPQRSAAQQAQQQNTGAPAVATVAATSDLAGLAAAGTAAQAAVQIQTAGAAAPSGSLSISTPLQQPQWPADFGRQVVTLAQTAHSQTQTAELRLDPPDLGPLRITININDNVAQAVFVSAHASVRHAVESALPQLQQQLAQAGISLGQTSVNDQGQQQTPFEQSFQSGGKQHAVTAAGTGGLAIEGAAARTVAHVSRNPDAIVDTFA